MGYYAPVGDNYLDIVKPKSEVPRSRVKRVKRTNLIKNKIPVLTGLDIVERPV